MQRNCKWCGKSYDDSKVSDVYASYGGYCSRRCRIAAENYDKKKASEAKAYWQAHPKLKLIRNIAICLLFVYAFFASRQ